MRIKEYGTKAEEILKVYFVYLNCKFKVLRVGLEVILGGPKLLIRKKHIPHASQYNYFK